MPQNLFKIYDGRNYFWQWDINQKLIVLDETVDEVHFSHKDMKHAIVKSVVTDKNGLRVCNIPDELLTLPKNLIASAYVTDNNENRTLRTVKFAVIRRPIPSDYVSSEDFQFNDFVERLETIEDIIEHNCLVQIFNSMDEAALWANETQKAGAIVSVHTDDEWETYIVEEDYSLYKIGDTDQLVIDVDRLQSLVGETTVEEQIRLAIIALNLPNTYDPLGAASEVRNELVEEIKRAQNEEAAITRELHKINNNISNIQDDIKDANAAIKEISDDYLKEIDRINLEKKIKSNTDTINLLTNGVDPNKIDGLNDLLNYVDEHGVEVTGMQASIKSNTDAIATEKSRATSVESALDKRIKVVEDMDISSKIDGFVSYKEQKLTDAQKAQARENIGMIAITDAEIDEICNSAIYAASEVEL